MHWFIKRFSIFVLAISLLGSSLVSMSPAYAIFTPDRIIEPGDSTSNTGANADIDRNIVTPAASNVDTGVPSLNSLVNLSLVDSQSGDRSSEGIFGLVLWNGVTALLGTGNGAPSGGVATTQGNKRAMVYPGAIGTTLHMTSIALTNPPVSSREYIADVINDFSHPFAPPAYAQGLGFSSLSPVLGLWKIFRNVAYFFFIVIFVFVGFLIMIRSKIGSQAAVTVQQALPKLVISLILVTFSYAIAGLLLDIMYLLIYLLIGIFAVNSESTPFLTTQNLNIIAFQNNIFGNAFKIIGEIIGGVAGSIGDIVQSLTSEAFGSTPIADAVSKVSGGITNVVAILVLAVAILTSLFRVFFALVQAYIGIFFSVIFAPIQLLIGALPGQNTFGTWIKGLLENMLVFPTLILLIFVAYYFTLGPTFTNENPGFSAPQLGSNQGEGGFRAYKGLVALGAILAMPEILKVTKGIMKGQLDVNMGDLKKNWDTGMKGAKRVALAPLNAGIGAGVGYLGAREVFKGTPNQGKAQLFGALGGGLFGGVSGAPMRLGNQAIKGALTYGGRAIASRGVETLTGKIEQQQNEKDLKEQQATFDATKNQINKKGKANEF